MLRWDLNRREFMKMAAGAGAALALPGSLEAAVCSSKMIGIQVGAVSFVDEGTERVLDVLQQRACVNTLFLRSRYRRKTDSGPAAARSRQAGVRSQFSRRELR